MKSAKLLKKMRTDADITQDDVAKILGYASKNTIWRKESGRCPVKGGDLTHLAMHLNLSVRSNKKGDWVIYVQGKG